MIARILAFLLLLLALASPAAAQKPARTFAPWPAKWIAHPEAPGQE